MIINFKSKYINPIEIYTHANLAYFHFYKNYNYLYSRRLIKCNNRRIKYLRIHKNDIKNIPIVHHLCMLSNINDEQLIFHAEIEDNQLFYIQPAIYIKDKEQLIINEKYKIYNLRELNDIYFNNVLIRKKTLQQIKNQLIDILNSRNVLNLL